MPSLSDVAELRAANQALSERVEADLAGFWRSLDLSKPEAARDALLSFVPALTSAYGGAAATIAADWYDEIRALEGVPGRFRASMAEVFPAEYVEGRVRFGASHLFTPTPDLMLPFLTGAAQKYAMQPGRDTIARSTLDDPQASGWHRETRATACKFCRMLAGRGGVYKETTAAFAAHGACHCVAAPSWDPNAPEVPASAYVASEPMQKLRDRAAKGDTGAQRQLDAHRERVRDFIAALDD